MKHTLSKTVLASSILCMALSSCQNYQRRTTYNNGHAVPNTVVLEKEFQVNPVQVKTVSPVIEMAPTITASTSFETTPHVHIEEVELAIPEVPAVPEIAVVVPAEPVEVLVPKEPMAVIPAVKPFEDTKPVFQKKKALTYKVKSGDNLSRIAYNHRISTQALIAANNLNPKKYLQIGQKLQIPGGKLRSRKELARLRKKKTKKTPYKVNFSSTKKKSAPKGIPANGIYTVKRGDNLWVVARRHNLHVAEIKAWNSLQSSSLKIGQKLKLTGSAQVAERVVAVVPKETEKIIDTTSVESDNTGTGQDTTDNKEVVSSNDATVVEVDPKKPEVEILPIDVLEGDTLESLANDYGSTVSLIKKYNPKIKSNEDIKEGDTLNIPTTN